MSKRMRVRAAVVLALATCGGFLLHGDEPPAPGAGAAAERVELTEAEIKEKLDLRNRLWASAREAGAARKFAEAAKLGEQVLAVERELLGDEHAELISTATALAGWHLSAEQWELARQARQDVVRRTTAAHGPDDCRVRDARRSLADVDIRQRLADRGRLRQAKSDSNRVVPLEGAAQHAEAVELARQILETRETLLGPDHPGTVSSLNNLAELYKSQDNHAAAEPLFQRALKIREKVLGPEHPNTAASLNNLAELYRVQGNFMAAEPLFQRALKIREKVLGPEHPNTAASLNNLAELYRVQWNFMAAEPLFQRALNIREKALGPDHPDTATSLNNLAELYRSQGNYAAAEPLYQRALKIREKALGPMHPDTATSLNNVAEMYYSQGNYGGAEPLYRRALQIRERALGTKHPDTAMSLGKLASLYESQGNYAASEPLKQRALKIDEKALGPEHPDTATVLSNLAMLYWQLEQAAAAQDRIRRGLAIKVAQLDLTAAIQTEQQQFLMTRQVAGDMGGWLTFTSRDAPAAEIVWQPIVRWKGLITARQQTLRLTLLKDPLFGEFQRASQQLSAVTLSPPLPPSDSKARASWEVREPELRAAWLAKKTELEAEHERLEKELAHKSAEFRQTQARREVTADDIVQALKKAPQPTALVDLLIYSYWGCKARREPNEYRVAAFVARYDGAITRVELGPAHAIVQQIQAWRESFGLPHAQTDPGHALRQLLLAPLLPHLDGIDTVLISPDRELAQLPWGALPGAKPGTYLIEERGIAVIPTPQMLPELLQSEPMQGPPASLLLAGDIDYGGDPGAPGGDRSATATALGRALGGKQFPRLEAAQPEFASIKVCYEKAAKKNERPPDVEALTDANATESAFRTHAPGKQWLHIITHGYFAPAGLTTQVQPTKSVKGQGDVSVPTVETGPVPGGLGVRLGMRNGSCFANVVDLGGAAASDGRLQLGDEIVAIKRRPGEWELAAGQEPGDVSSLIRGGAGTKFSIKVRPASDPTTTVEYELTRAAIPGQAAPRAVALPGLLSGLAFAGANTTPEPGKDDGILTALEVAALDLGQVDTVVLSACETGLGEVAGGEGLLGLQRAFQVAGAKTVVASLWKVSDRATQILMQRFYENLWDKHMGKLAALREAQIWMLHDQGLRSLLELDKPNNNTPLPPQYWAAFVLSGDWR